MYQTPISKSRGAHRSQLLMTCEIEHGGECRTVKLRNLSAHGAMVEEKQLPLVGSPILFRKGEISASGVVIWSRIGRAGIKFDSLVPEKEVMRHVPNPRTRPQPKFGRPGLKSQPLTESERRVAEHYVWGDPLVPPTGK